MIRRGLALFALVFAAFAPGQPARAATVAPGVMAHVTAADALQTGDILVGAARGASSFGTVGGQVLRVRGTDVATFCHDWYPTVELAEPSEIAVDDSGGVEFLAWQKSAPQGVGLFRCASLGAEPERLVFFGARGATDPAYPVNLPATNVGSLNVAAVRGFKVTDLTDPKRVEADMLFVLVDGILYTYDLGTRAFDIDRSFFPYAPGGNAVVIGNSDRWTTDGIGLRREHMAMNIQVDGTAGGLPFHASLGIGGYMADVQNVLADDVTVPNVPSGCQGGAGVPTAMPWVGSFLRFDHSNIEYGGKWPLIISNGGWFPAGIATLGDEALLNGDPSDDLGSYFTQPYLQCTPVKAQKVQPIMPHFASTGYAQDIGIYHGSVAQVVDGSGRGPIYAAGEGRLWDIPVMGDRTVHTTTTTLYNPSSVTTYPPHAPQTEQALLIQVNSPVNVLAVASDGRRIGVATDGTSVNDFGVNGYVGTAGEPRFFGVVGVAPGDFTLQAVGTATGDYTISVYGMDGALATGSVQRIHGATTPGAVLDTTFTVTSGMGIQLAQSDTTAPATTAAIAPAPSADGWERGATTVNLSATDETGGSGVKEIHYRASGANTIGETVIAGASATVALSSDGVTDVTYWAVDNAGNAEIAHTTTVRIDATPPTVSCGAADSAWHATNVTISCGASDATSGLASAADASFTLATSVASGSETANASTDTRSVCDAAGNCATSGPITGIKVDRKAPALSAAISPAPNANGWTNADTTVTFTATDGGSGVASVTTPVTFTGEGAGQSVTGTATDAVGNTATLTASVSIDRTMPQALVSFDLASRDVVVSGRDALSGVTPGPIAPTSVTPIPTGADRDDAENGERAELRSYTVSDLAGNATTFDVVVRRRGHRIDASVGRTALLSIEWSVDRSGAIATVEQEARVGELEREALYDARRDATRIGEAWVPGYVPLVLLTGPGGTLLAP